MKRIFLFLIAIMTIFSCSNKNKSALLQESEQQKDSTMEEDHTFDPPLEVVGVENTKFTIQPYNMSYKEAEKFRRYLKSINEFRKCDITIATPKQLDSTFYNSTRSRFQAQKILSWQKNNKKLFAGWDNGIPSIVIGFIHRDISIPLHGKKDWGIQGLGAMGKHHCLVSDFRVKNKKSDLWKLTLHEVGHAFNLSDCQFKSDTCIMNDCQGKPNWSKRKAICYFCMRIGVR